jgi:3-oxoadipate enol-lactonase
VALSHELAGSGAPVVFLHEGIADSRMWDPQWTSFAQRYRLVRCDLAGFGRTPIERVPLTHARDVAELLGELRTARAGLIGCSLGGRVALELAVAHPELVRALVLCGAGLPDFEWSDAVRTYGAAEDEAVARGDLDAATELNMRMWVDGPRRSPEDVDPGVRAAMAEMQRHALELQGPRWSELDEDLLVPDVAARLGEVRAPTLVLVGEEDVEDMHRIADTLAASIPDARRATIPGAAHVPNLEQPAAFDALVLEFLADALD